MHYISTVWCHLRKCRKTSKWYCQEALKISFNVKIWLILSMHSRKNKIRGKNYSGRYFSVVQLLSHVQLSVTLWTRAHQASLSFIISLSLFKLMSIESVMLFNHLILCRPLLLLPSIFPSITVFSSESALHIKWPKYFSFSISPSNEYSGLISFRIDSFDLLAVQGTFKSLLQYHSSKTSILWPSAFFMVQLSHQQLL